MSLSGALNIGKSALTAHQAALQVTSNNIANAGNADYTRQVGKIDTRKDQEIRPGLFMGTGVDLTSVQRQINEALQGRIRSAVSDGEGANALNTWVSQIEGIFNELTDDDLSTQLSKFFNAWSDLANKPQDLSLRQVVLQTGSDVARWFQNITGSLTALQTDMDRQMAARVTDADQLAGRVAELNTQIAVAEGGQGSANALRDERDAALQKLAEVLPIKTMEQPNGMMNVYVGSEPLVMNSVNYGVALRQDVVDGKVVSKPVFKNSGAEMAGEAGMLGGLSKARNVITQGVIDQLDAVAGGLIFELNKLHATGQGLAGQTAITGTLAVEDATSALDSKAAGLDFAPQNGSFVVHVKNSTTGLVSSELIEVPLNGTAGGMSLNDLAAAINGVADVSASVIGGKLRITSDTPDSEISFSQDSSGVLAALGVNTFFTGSRARDMAVRQELLASPTLLAASQNGESGDNRTALAIAAMEKSPLAALNGQSIVNSYQSIINHVAVETGSAKSRANAAGIVRETLQGQRDAISGVSLDEEAVNLMRQQRAFQGAARLVTAVDELMRTILQMV